MIEACYLQFISLPGRSSTIMSRINRETEEGSRWNCPFGLAFFVARRACRQLEPKPADAVHPVLSWNNNNTENVIGIIGRIMSSVSVFTLPCLWVL
jgi:hypothetical protein